VQFSPILHRWWRICILTYSSYRHSGDPVLENFIFLSPADGDVSDNNFFPIATVASRVPPKYIFFRQPGGQYIFSSQIWRRIATNAPTGRSLEQLDSCRYVGSTPPLYESTPYHRPIVINSPRPEECANKSTSPSEDQSNLDADISEDEVIAALGKLRSKKAPGIAGISAELLKSAIDVLVTPLTESYV
jgi:hypothetical protein